MKLEDFFTQTTEGWFVCDFCGALVTDTVRHLRWHRLHGDLPYDDPVLPRSAPLKPACSTCGFSHWLGEVVAYHCRQWSHAPAVPADLDAQRGES